MSLDIVILCKSRNYSGSLQSMTLAVFFIFQCFAFVEP
jgi:hypothetical protein